MVSIHIYLNSVLKYKSLILDAYHPDTVYLSEPGCDDPWLSFEATSGPQENVWTTLLYAALLFPIRATCSAHYSLLDLVTRIIFGEVYRS
jgi:hypothetical protein